MGPPTPVALVRDIFMGGSVVEPGELVARFRDLYGREPRLFKAPGRVNLIGEHTDYNDGFVLPIAINFGIMVAAAARNDRRIRVCSVNFDETADFDLDNPGPQQRGVWADYVEGMAQALLNLGLALKGVDMVLWGDVSLGGGLSSSAALEMSVGMAMLGVSGIDLDRKSLALAGQKAEHTYVGTKCGIMDQFIGAMGKEDHALLIDCRRLEGRLIPFHLDDAAVVVCNTKVRHNLASTEYNARRAECGRGVEILREALPRITALRDVSPSDFRKVEQRLPEPVRRRCRHVISENERTVQAARALESGSIGEMGKLMNASHDSLRDDYQVSCRELDIMVEIARSLPGVEGARMTGGGFGGCTINLVRTQNLDLFRTEIAQRYQNATGHDPDIFVVRASAGADELPREMFACRTCNPF